MGVVVAGNGIQVEICNVSTRLEGKSGDNGVGGITARGDEITVDSSPEVNSISSEVEN